MEDEVGSTEFRGESEVTLILIVVSPNHTLRDLKLFFTGMNFSIARLFPEIQSYDA
jgi:hypothetical protein